MYRIIFGISGASGIPLAETILKNLEKITEIETHIIISQGARRVCAEEGNLTVEELESLGSFAYSDADMGAPPSSGSWICHGMIICPCSMHTLAAIATGAGWNLLHRAADVTLKERRPLILVPRESPLNLIHLRNMLYATEAGALIMPFMPPYYTKKKSIEEMESQFTGRILDQLKITHNLCFRWREDV